MYQGGSGGFLLFYYMLLSGEYTTGLDIERIEEYIEIQYHTNLANDKKSWKVNTEHWPDNLRCKNSSSDKPKLFLVCNPITKPYSINKELQNIVSDTKIILLYTDLRTHLRMSHNKQAYWFYWLNKLNNHKFNRLTKKAFIRIILNSGVWWKNQLSDPELPKINKIFPELEAINLRDLIQNYPKNEKQQWLIDRWLSLHTKKELRHLL